MKIKIRQTTSAEREYIVLAIRNFCEPNQIGDDERTDVSLLLANEIAAGEVLICEYVDNQKKE